MSRISVLFLRAVLALTVATTGYTHHSRTNFVTDSLLEL